MARGCDAGDPTVTVHFKVAVGFRFVGTVPTRGELAKQAVSADPADRREYLMEVALS